MARVCISARSSVGAAWGLTLAQAALTLKDAVGDGAVSEGFDAKELTPMNSLEEDSLVDSEARAAELAAIDEKLLLLHDVEDHLSLISQDLVEPANKVNAMITQSKVKETDFNQPKMEEAIEKIPAQGFIDGEVCPEFKEALQIAVEEAQTDCVEDIKGLVTCDVGTERDFLADILRAKIVAEQAIRVSEISEQVAGMSHQLGRLKNSISNADQIDADISAEKDALTASGSASSAIMTDSASASDIN